MVETVREKNTEERIIIITWAASNTREFVKSGYLVIIWYNFSYVSIKMYVEALLMSTNNICF